MEESFILGWRGSGVYLFAHIHSHFPFSPRVIRARVIEPELIGTSSVGLRTWSWHRTSTPAVQTFDSFHR